MAAINIPSLNISGIEEGLGNKQAMEQILDTLQKYRKELNFLLMNLDLDNMPAVANLLGDIDGDFSLIQQTIDGILLAVGNTQGDLASLNIRADQIAANVSNNKGDISALVIRAGSIESTVAANTGEISSVKQTAAGILTRVGNNEGQISTIKQTAAGIQTQVNSLDSEVGSMYSSITQLNNSITSKVSKTDYTGATLISLIEQTAGSIKLSANAIRLDGITTVNKNLTIGSGSDNGVLRFRQGMDISAGYGNDGIGLKYSAGEHIFDGTFFTVNTTITKFTGNVDFKGANVSGIQARFA